MLVNQTLQNWKTTLLDVTLLDPQSAALTLSRLSENQSEAAARLAHRVFTIYETTLLKEFLKHNSIEGVVIEQSDLTLAKGRLPYEGGAPTERLAKLSGPVERLRDILRAKSNQPASVLSLQALEAYKNLCEKMKVFIPRDGVDRVLFTDNLQKLTEANPKLKQPTLGLGMEMVKNWRGLVPTIPGNTIDLGVQVQAFGKSLAQTT